AVSGKAVCGSGAGPEHRSACGGVRTGQLTTEQLMCGRARQPGVCAESEETKTGGAEFCLDQALGGVPSGEVAKSAAGGVAVSDCGCGLQSGPRHAPATSTHLNRCTLAAPVRPKGKPEPTGTQKKRLLDASPSAIGEFFSRLFSRRGKCRRAKRVSATSFLARNLVSRYS